MRSLSLGLALRNLRADWFATLSAIFGVALGVATVNTVLILDVNTRDIEAHGWSTNPDLDVDEVHTVSLKGVLASGAVSAQADAKKETHEDYQVMRSALRLGSLSAFLVGALIVFFTFRVIVEERRREIALLRSLGSTARQVASIFFVEASLVGLVGAVIGFVIAPPLSIAAAIAGITTTGRSSIGWLWFPWKHMLVVSTIGACTALLGIARPLWDVLRLDVPRTLRPQFLEEGRPVRAAHGKSSGVTLIALPFMALLYVLVRPFFYEVLPSLAFFVFESGVVCAGFLSLLVLVPELVRGLGRVVATALPRRPLAPRLLTLRRIDRVGHEFAWAVSGVMLVFALLLSLHIVTHALKLEVTSWATAAVHDKAFVYARKDVLPDELVQKLPADVEVAHFSSRSAWPNALIAVRTPELVAIARGEGEEVEAITKKLAPGKVILSTMMSKRFGLSTGDFLEVSGGPRAARLEVVGVTDRAGYIPMVGPYRNSKTYGVIAAEDFDLIAPFAAPIGSGVVLRRRGPAGAPGEVPWRELLRPLGRHHGIEVEIGERIQADRVRETDKDFALFDVILFLTGLLAAVGIANNLVLSAHMRRRELALYRVLGMEVAQIRTLFLMEGAFIGLLGGLLSVVLGIPLGFAAIGALEVVSAFAVHFDLPPVYALYTLAGAVLVAVASSIYPAARASRYSSAESVHYE